MWHIALAIVACGALPPPHTAGSYDPPFLLWHSNSGYSVNRGASANGDVVAFALYKMSVLDVGWDYLSVRSLPASIDEDYDAGYLEGYVTYERMGQVLPFQNYTTTAREEDWLDRHIAYIRRMAGAEQAPFWVTVGRLLRRMDGIADGYTRRGAEVGGASLSFRDVFRFNFNDEIGDVANALGIVREDDRRQHCSALVKLTSDELFTSHATWGAYSHMVRQFKDYSVGGTIIAFTGVAGFVASGDDYYVTSHQLAVQETTNDYYNMTLAKEYVQPESVSEFLRVMAANVLAADGQTWAAYFAMNNSGTYCNQYMVVDYKRYTRGDKPEGLQDGLLWVAEQMPGNVTSGDMTDVLRRTTYWASYNIPYFPNVYDASGFREEERLYGTFFSYTKYARPEIFRRNHSRVTDLDTMRAMMRYNNYADDPLSDIPNCTACSPVRSPMLSIASRGDLVASDAVLPPPPMNRHYDRSGFGAYDAKITSAEMMAVLQSTLVMGPTTDGQPVFSWEGVSMPRPAGAPARYDFEWTFMNAQVAEPWARDVTALEVAIAAAMAAIVGAAILLVATVACCQKRAKRPLRDTEEPLKEDTNYL